MRMRWKLLGVAGAAGVAATGAVVARRRRDQHDYTPDELRDRLRARLAAAVTTDPPPAGSGPPPAARRRP